MSNWLLLTFLFDDELSPIAFALKVGCPCILELGYAEKQSRANGTSDERLSLP